MQTASPQNSKKVLLLNILDILRRYTDEDHRLSQKEIVDILRTEYNMTVDRKAVKRNLMNLIDFGYEVEYSESVRMTPDPKTGQMEENHILSDFYLSREFTDGELRLLIDSLLFSKHVPYSQCKELVEKLEGLSNVYFRARVKHIFRMPEDRADNKQIFLNIELLDEAISKGRKVSFRYTEYGTDKKQHYRTRPDGTVREYIVSPYQMAAKEGKYYLICNYDKYDDISNYRLDRIRELKVLDEPIKPYESLRWAGGRPLDLAEYMKKHVRGKYPIYDQFALFALEAISGGKKPGDKVEFHALPDKSSKRFGTIMQAEMRSYISSIESIFGSAYWENRDIDRALWVYGHMFSKR